MEASSRITGRKPASDRTRCVPGWVPVHAMRYLHHTEKGVSIRHLARRAGVAPSTVLRQIRRLESSRDDPLVDAALDRLRSCFSSSQDKDLPTMTPQADTQSTAAPVTHPDTERVEKEALRILRRLCESGAVLVVSADMEQAVVIRQIDDVPRKIAVVGREIAQAFALNDWIKVKKAGRVTQYVIAHPGRMALKRLLAAKGEPDVGPPADTYAEQHRTWGSRPISEPGEDQPRVQRYNLAESPLATLARRKDKSGTPFLTDEMVSAGERLREDFEIAQMGPRVTQNWQKFLVPSERGSYTVTQGTGDGAQAARNRVQEALAELGPGLGDVALRCCCFLEGLEAAEKRMGWSARSGKIVLRIALQRLAQHYDRIHGAGGGLIG